MIIMGTHHAFGDTVTEQDVLLGGFFPGKLDGGEVRAVYTDQA